MADDPHAFDFDLDRGIRDQVIEALEDSPKLPLHTGIGPRLSGVYALYYKGKLVYIGKATREMTKSGRTLRGRLNEHVIKISGRQDITLADMQCQFLTFKSEWWVIAAEFALMTTYKPEWNFTGFESKTPGKGRPGTERISVWIRCSPPKIP